MYLIETITALIWQCTLENKQIPGLKIGKALVILIGPSACQTNITTNTCKRLPGLDQRSLGTEAQTTDFYSCYKENEYIVESGSLS